MRDMLICDSCGSVVREADAIDWWTVSRMYPFEVYGKEPESWDFCSETCFDTWIEQRRRTRREDH